MQIAISSYEHDPSNIEGRSFEIIRNTLACYAIEPSLMEIAVRVVHAGADFSLATLIEAHNGALRAASAAITGGGTIYCDVEMLKSGISREECSRLNLRPMSYIHDDEVSGASERLGITRAMASVDKALEDGVRI
ncbi:MAG: precorrin-8X methylmutase, partial [Synergistaceae bacterium]|nr:precorrin-8X methylmutase [Synergistaceae bacterium]